NSPLIRTTTSTQNSTLSLPDPLPICCHCSETTPPARRRTTGPFCPRRLRATISWRGRGRRPWGKRGPRPRQYMVARRRRWQKGRSEEHTSELQSRGHLVYRLLHEQKK